MLIIISCARQVSGVSSPRLMSCSVQPSRRWEGCCLGTSKWCICVLLSIGGNGIETENDEKMKEPAEKVHVLRLFSSAVAKALSPSSLSCHSFWTNSRV